MNIACITNDFYHVIILIMIGKISILNSYSGGSREAIIDGKEVYLIKSDDATSLIDKIIFLYYNKKIHEELGAFGHIHVIDYFDWNKIALKYHELFRTLIMEYKLIIQI